MKGLNENDSYEGFICLKNGYAYIQNSNIKVIPDAMLGLTPESRVKLFSELKNGDRVSGKLKKRGDSAWSLIEVKAVPEKIKQK